VERERAELIAERVIARDQRRFVFDDEYALHMLVRENLFTGIPMPSASSSCTRSARRMPRPTAWALGSKLFWPAFFKRQGITFWLTFADKFGTPTAVGKYPPGASSGDQEKLLAALAAIAQDAGVIIPTAC